MKRDESWAYVLAAIVMGGIALVVWVVVQAAPSLRDSYANMTFEDVKLMALIALVWAICK